MSLGMTPSKVEGSPRGGAMRRRGAVARNCLAAAPLPLDERAILAHQQIEVFALFVREFEEDLLAFGILEPLAVLLEEEVGVALAADADEQRLLIVDAAQQPVGAFREQSVRRALEEEKRRLRFELRIASEQLAVAAFELAEMFFLFRGEVLEDLAPAGIARHARGAGEELEAAALGVDGAAQRVARKEQIGMSRLRGGAVTARAALLALPVDLHDALRGAEAARVGDFLDERLDVGAEELERAAAALADEVKVTRLTVGVLEAETAFAEIDLARDAGVDHPLQGAVDSRAADAVIFAAYQVDEIVGAEVAFLAQEDVDDLFALARPFSASRLQAAEIRKITVHQSRHPAPVAREYRSVARYTLNELPHPQ